MILNSAISHYASVGDYLFLIMIVLATIIQSIAQNKKKKALKELTQDKNGETNKASDVIGKEPEKMTGYDRPFDNIFDTIEKILIPEPDTERHDWGDDYPETVTAKKDESEIGESSYSLKEKFIQVIPEKLAEPTPSEPASYHADIHFKSKIRDGFSLKKAVVYSEILNRKYT